MKRIFITMAVILAFFATDLRAQCPAGYTAGADVTKQICYDCTNCGYFVQDMQGNTKPSSTDLITWIIQDGTNWQLLNVPYIMDLPTPQQAHNPGMGVQMEESVGECYYKYMDIDLVEKYTTCTPLVIGKCYTYYSLCRILVPPSTWILSVEGEEYSSENFVCEPPCFKLCE